MERLDSTAEKPRIRVRAESVPMGAIDYLPSASISGHDALLRRIVPGKTHASVHVSEHQARHYPIVYACVNRISNPIAHFPIQIMRPGKVAAWKRL